MFSKVAVKGDGTAPLFAWLQGKETNPSFGGPIKWNFNKFLVGKDGSVIGRFEPQVEPTSAEVKTAIEKALG
jgi:glutathione peroxidase